jgi:hypothetical protein
MPANESLRILGSRVTVSIVLGVLLTGIALLVTDHLPPMLAMSLNIPTVIFCYVDRLIETAPANDPAFWEQGRAATCFLVGILLNIPFYSLLVFGILTFRARMKRRANHVRV